MRTLIVSDLHLGNGAGYDVFAGGSALPAMLDTFVSPPSRVILNGDSVDFLMNEDPLELSVPRAVGQARAIASEPASRAVFEALGRVLAGGGEVIVRLGNHDVEVALPEVQEVLRGALGQPKAIADKLVFQTGEAPAIIEVGGAKILVTHGEHCDPWNVVDYSKLGKSSDYKYAPGSQLVKQFMNPLKREFKMRFADLLKPDFQGAVLTALAVAPSATKILLQKASISIAWQLFRKMSGPTAFDHEETNLGLADRVEAAGLSAEEQAALEGILGDGPASFADDEEEQGILAKASVKLAKAGLGAYARLQQRMTGTSGQSYFELTPGEAEWEDAKRLAAKYGVGAVLIGHTHSARWREADGVVFANTGTWIYLMSLPRADAPAEDWEAFLLEMKKNPALSEEKAVLGRLSTRFTAALAEPLAEGGASLSLVEWIPAEGALRTLGSTRLPPK